MADVTSEPKPFNPFEPGFAEDPYPQFAELSAGNPVQQTPLGLWALFGYSLAFGNDVGGVARSGAPTRS